jgi:3-hydroxyisobutyrate dehydrogenase-like beta-hydroxyacid dehydrogenase
VVAVGDAGEVAFIGLGGMGAAMAHRLRAEGLALTVYNRTAAKALPLAEAGARVAGSVDEAAAAGTVVLSLSDESAVEEVVFGAAGRFRPGTLLVDTSTVSPAYSVDAGERLARIGIRRVEACVVGNPAMARAGKLRIFTAGADADRREVAELLAALAQEVMHVGAPGSACALKLAFNLILGNQVAALAEALSLAESAGLDRDTMLDAVTRSGFSSPILAFRAELMRHRGYEPPAFRSVLMEKDLRIAVTTAAARGLDLPVTATAAGRFAETVLRGDGDKDAAVIAELGSPVR